MRSLFRLSFSVRLVDLDMRQINFLLMFGLCLALVFFGVQNTQLTVVHLLNGVEFQAPLAVELLLAMGLGAVLAWVFSLWTRLQRLIEVGREVRARDNRIQALEKDLEHYKAELEEQQRLLPAAPTPMEETAEASAELIT